MTDNNNITSKASSFVDPAIGVNTSSTGASSITDLTLAISNATAGVASMKLNFENKFKNFEQNVSNSNAEYQKKLDDLEARLSRPVFGKNVSQKERSNFASFMRGKMNDQEYMSTFASGSTLTDAQGGIVVPVEVDQNLIEEMAKDSPIRGISDVMTVGSEDVRFPVNLRGAGASWVGEGETAERPETNAPSLGKMAVSFGELYAAPRASQKLIEDAFIDIESWYVNTISQQFAEAEDTAFVTGNGTDKPFGFLSGTPATTDDDTRAYGTLQKIASATAATVSLDDLIGLIGSLRSGYRNGASFVMNRTTETALRKLKDANNNYIWTQSIVLGQPNTLFGYPVIVDDNMPVIASGALSVAFGNFKAGYRVLDRIGTTMLRDPYTAKPYVSFYTRKRVGGGIKDSLAIKLLEVA